MHPSLLHFGHVAIPTFGAFTALALVAALTAVVFFARRLSLDANKIWNLSITGILAALIGARLLLVLLYFSAFREHPFWVFGLTTSRNPWIAVVSAGLGLTAMILYALAEGLPLLRTLDCVAPSAALALAISHVGAFLGGCDFGLPTERPWSVTYTSSLAAIWYRTPLGIPLHPVQLYDAAASLLIFVVLAWWISRRTQDGEIAGAWLFLYSFASFFIDLYRGDASQLALSQPIAAVAVLAGALLCLHRPAVTSGSAQVLRDGPA